MKKHLQIIICCLFGLLLFTRYAGASEIPRKWTVLVYMCGSNLESGFGSATEDIQEMLDAEISNNVTVLIMTGGTKAGNNTGFFRESASEIHEIAAGKSRRVWQSEEKLNMGSPDTLTGFLTFGTENYPAQNTALILWDHGGGPAEGICWDELFTPDHLSLTELTNALDAAGLTQKLRWIGFDACLMSSLEVASALAPYAEYMIASQETEPAHGWNYAFLRSLQEDDDISSVGKQIIDLYFEGSKNTGDILTLACLDLSKAGVACETLNRFFAPLSENITAEHFAKYSGIRLQTTGFGQSVRSTEETGYDLVDAEDLIRHLDGTSEAYISLKNALDQMIVYNRSNDENAHGISLYHPYSNKTGYLEKWCEQYQQLHFCPGYTKYIRAFGELLTGDMLSQWRNLNTRDLGNYTFSVQLTPSQVENFASAQLLILAGGFNHMGQIDDSVLVYSGPAVLQEDGSVSGNWPVRTLFAEDENGNLHGPLSFLLTDDNKYQVVTGVYTPNGKDLLQDAVQVRYYLQETPGKDEPEIVQTRVWSNLTESFSTRQYFSEDNYNLVNLWFYFRTLPESNGSEPLPAYMDWPVNIDSFHHENLPLPQDWRFRYINGFQSGEQYFAVLQIVDIQQNVWCSRPVMMQNPNLIRVLPETTVAETGTATVMFSAYWDASPIDSGLQLFAEMKNHGEKALNLRISEIVINETRSVSQFGVLYNAEPGKSQGERIDIPADQFIGLKNLESISLVCTYEDNADYNREPESFPVKIIFENYPIPLRNDYPTLAKTVKDEISWELLSATTDPDNQIWLLLHVSNESDTAFHIPTGDVGINHLLLDATWLNVPDPLPSGCDAIFRICIPNLSEVISLYNKLEINGDERSIPNIVMAGDLLQTEGETDLHLLTLNSLSNQYDMSIALLFGDTNETIQLKPTDAIPLFDNISPDKQGGLLIAKSDCFEIRMQQILVGNNGIYLCIRAMNCSGMPLTFELSDIKINGIQAESSRLMMENPAFMIEPGMVYWFSESFALPDPPEPGTLFSQLSFTVRTENEETQYPVLIRPVRETPFGMPGGAHLQGNDLY